MKEYQTFQMADFAQRANAGMLDQQITDQLKRHLLDSVGSLLYALEQPTVQRLIEQIRQMAEGGHCAAPIIGKIAADRAAQYFTALIRYPDFMDNYLGKEATCHPSDNIGSLLAAAQLVHCSGRDFLLAMAVGYEIECRLVEEIPVMIKGFDHTTLLAYSVTAALSKMLGLTGEQTANAISMAGCAFNPLVTCRASYTYEWKGFASSLVAMGCFNIIGMAKEGMTGPIELFEGPKGFCEVYDMKLNHDWRKEDFSLIEKCILKSYNAEVHTQSAIEAALELKEEHGFACENIESINVTTFLTAYHIVGCGAYGDRMKVFSKEQADHSLPYTLAAALLDDQVYPDQLKPERIRRSDVQELLKKVSVHTASPIHRPVLLAGLLDPYTEAYPKKVPAKVVITFNNGEKLSREKDDYHGFHTRPLDWKAVEEKFIRLTGHLDRENQQQIIDIIQDLENRSLDALTDQLVIAGHVQAITDASEDIGFYNSKA